MKIIFFCKEDENLISSARKMEKHFAEQTRKNAKTFFWTIL